MNSIMRIMFQSNRPHFFTLRFSLCLVVEKMGEEKNLEMHAGFSNYT
jgi:hypothetical protein